MDNLLFEEKPKVHADIRTVMNDFERGLPPNTVKAKNAPGLVGIFLKSGGQKYLKIEENEEGFLHVVEPLYSESDEIDWVITKEKQIIRFTRYFRFSHFHYWSESFEVQRSKHNPGDWDLYSLGQYYGNNDATSKEPVLVELDQPVISYLHSVNDKRVSEYFKSVFNKFSPTLKPSEINKIYKLASGLLSDWKDPFQTSEHPYIQQNYKVTHRGLEILKLSAEGKNAFDWVWKLAEEKEDLKSWLHQFPDILDYEFYAEPKYPTSLAIPNYLIVQTMVKVLRTEAVFLLFQGKHLEAQKLLDSTHHMGLLLTKNDTHIARLIGVAVRGISIAGFETYLLNACENAEDLDILTKKFDQIAAEIPTITSKDLVEFDSRSSIEQKFLSQYASETLTRIKVAEAKFQNLRMAAAAKRHLLSNKNFPKKVEELELLFSKIIPNDPFSGKSMKFLNGPDTFVSYSVGPDEEDNFAKIEYDPTNGTISDGDLILRVPREREYPFPPNGVQANTADDLRAQFPNGLPMDVFGQRSINDGLLQISNTYPLYVFSAGPNLQAETGNKLSDFLPYNHYDPTNGTISDGDLFVRIPTK